MRPEKLTYELIEAICSSLAEGHTFDKAARINGIGPSTFYRWRNYGAQPDAEQIYQDFARRVKESIVFYADEALQIVRNEAVIHRNLRAAIWFLEATLPEVYGQSRLNLQKKKGNIDE